MRKKLPDDPPSCGSCRFFLKNQHDDAGYCRRNPPTAIPDGEGAYVSVMVITTAEDFCGEYQRVTH